MFNFSQYAKQKLERTKILAVHKISIGPESMPISADKYDEDLNEAHWRSIINEKENIGRSAR